MDIKLTDMEKYYMAQSIARRVISDYNNMVSHKSSDQETRMYAFDVIHANNMAVKFGILAEVERLILTPISGLITDAVSELKRQNWLPYSPEVLI